MPTTTIESLAYGGDGIGKLDDGRVVFIPQTCPGDTCEFELTERKDRFAKGALTRIVEPSEHRVPSPCADAVLGRCGGCPWASLAYEEQLVWKRRFLVDALVRIGAFSQEQMEETVGACVPSAKQWHYRNKLEFEVGQDVAGRFTLGMHAAKGSFNPLSSCELCNKKFRHAPKALTGALRYLQGNDDLGIQRAGLRISERTGDVELAIWTRTGRFPRARAAKVLSDALPVKRPSISRVLLKGEVAERKVTGVESLAGHGNWAEDVLGRRMLFSAPSFFQVNTPGAETLVQLVCDGLDVEGLDTVADLYCGAGTFTLPMAETAMNVIAIESYGSSIRDLRRNLERNELFAEVIGGDVARELADIGHIDKAIVDPPRSGLGTEATDALIASRPHAIAYVSCNPTTLARDLQRLCNEGSYVLERATPVDLFPQTYHVETVAILVHKD